MRREDLQGEVAEVAAPPREVEVETCAISRTAQNGIRWGDCGGRGVMGADVQGLDTDGNPFWTIPRCEQPGDPLERARQEIDAAIMRLETARRLLED